MLPHRPIPLDDKKFYDEAQTIAEIRRVFDICHGCRRCFNLCGLFPKLFDLLDSDGIDGDVDKITAEHIEDIIPTCTLCDMCYMVKCPYVPPHPWNVDFPRVILRYRAIQAKKKSGWKAWTQKQMASVDNYAPLACSALAPAVNAALQCPCLRKAGEWIAQVDKRAHIPAFSKKPLQKTWTVLDPNPKGYFYGQEIWFYITCFVNFYASRTGQAGARILSFLGFKVHALYPGCCGMPLWEQGHLESVKKKAITLAPHFVHATTVITLTPSCTLMLKSEWPALAPQHKTVQDLAKKTFDLAEFCWNSLQQARPQWALSVGDKKVTAHMACHVRAQNKGNPSHNILHSLLGNQVGLMEKCSGHGGIWGYMKDNFDNATLYAQRAMQHVPSDTIITTECPLAEHHLAQSLSPDMTISHPLVLVDQLLQEQHGTEYAQISSQDVRACPSSDRDNTIAQIT